MAGLAAVAAATLGVAVTAVAYGQTGERIRVDGSTGVMPLVAALAKTYQQRHPSTTVELGKGLGTRARLAALTDGTIDIALASHGLDAAELSRHSLTAHEIAKGAVVFGANASVPVLSLTEAQVCEVYSGRLESWRDAGGPDLAVVPLTRPDSEVDAEVVRAKIPCLKELRMPERVRVMPRSGDMARELAATPGAIGMTTMTVVEQSQGRIRAVALGGVSPSRDNVERGLYRLTRDAFLVTRASPPTAVVQFIEFIRGADGRAVIVENGAVPTR